MSPPLGSYFLWSQGTWCIMIWEHSSPCNVTVPWGTEYVCSTCIPSSGLDTEKVPNESSLIYRFSMLANKPGSAFSISFLKIFKINPRDAGRSWQADQKWEKQQETLEFRELCVWQEKYSIHRFSWPPEEPPDALACPLQKIFLKCISSAIVYQKMTFFNGVQSAHAL